MPTGPINSVEQALLRAINAANTNRITLQEVMDDSGFTPDEDTMEAVAQAKIDEEAAQAYLEAHAPKCPSCKQAYAFQRQTKAPDRCSWCGYDHKTGDVAGFVSA